MKKILMLAYVHSGLDGRIFHKEAQTLKENYEVTVLSFCPHRKSIYSMGMDILPEGAYNGVEVVSFYFNKIENFIYRAVRKLYRKLPFIRKYIDYNELFIMNTSIMRAIKEKDLKFDYIHFHEPCLLDTAVKLKKKYGSKLIHDLHEMSLSYHLSKKGTIKYAELRRAYLKWLKYFPYLDATISVNNYIRAVNLTLNPYIPNILIENTSLFSRQERKESEKIRLIHEGNLSFSRGLEFACDLFDDQWMRENVSIQVIGKLNGPVKEYFDNRCKEKEYLKEAIKFTGWIDYKNVENYINGDIGIIFMEPFHNNLLAGPPNKLYNCLASGIPVLSFDLPATTDIIQRYDVGIIADRTASSVITGIKKIIESYDYYKSNIEKSIDKFQWDDTGKQLVALYRELEKS